MKPPIWRSHSAYWATDFNCVNLEEGIGSRLHTNLSKIGGGKTAHLRAISISQSNIVV